MRIRDALSAVFVFLALSFLLAVKASAQPTVSPADVQRLQETVYDVGSDIARLRARDPQFADQLQGELDNLRDEVIYVKVKLRKEGSVPRSEYSDLRDRLESVRARASGDVSYGAPREAPPAQTPPTSTGRAAATSGPANGVPVGAELDVRLQAPLSSATAQVEDRFEATTMVDLSSGGRVLIPAGSLVRGVVTSVNKAGRLDRTGRLTVAFDQITVRGRPYPIRATVEQVLQSEGVRGEAGKIAAGAGVGAIIGGILGGVRGALAGILIGGGGTVAATEGTDVELPPGTVLRVRFDSPAVIQ
jgi:hypothetical protein